MTTACGKKTIYECVACHCLTFGTILLVIPFSLAIGFLMAVINMSIAVPIDFYIALPISESL